MKIARYDDDRVGLVRDDRVHDVTTIARSIAPEGRVGDSLVLALRDLRSASAGDLGPSRPISEVRLLSPIAAPGKIVAAPVNYLSHIAEMHASNVSPGHGLADIGRAGLFLKASSSLVGPSEGIAQRFLERRTDYELELVVVIGATCANVSRADALSFVVGYCLGLDITVRGTEDRSFRKSCDTYSVIGPWLTTADEIANPDSLQMSLRQNGDLRQNANTSDMVYDVARIIEFAASFYTLHPGDLIFTGTPEGVGPIRPGDHLVAECAQLGAMSVAVRAHQSETFEQGRDSDGK